jgi:hypothetical protein
VAHRSAATSVNAVTLHQRQPESSSSTSINDRVTACASGTNFNFDQRHDHGFERALVPRVGNNVLEVCWLRDSHPPTPGGGCE